MTYKILVFSSNPTDTQQLGLNKEFRQIEEARRDSQIEPPIGIAEGFPYRLLTMPKHPPDRRYWAV